MKWQRPLGPPDAPSIISITPIKLGAAEIIVRAPENNGGARITSYSVVQFNDNSAPSKSSVGSRFLGTSAVSYPLKSREKISVGGLTPGQSYRFAVVASNIAGTSELSESSEEHFVSKSPNQPTITSVSALSPGSALISFAVSESEMTAPITSFTITANPGGLQSTVTSPLLRSHTFIGLSPLTPYTFSITANSDAGSSSPSEPSMSVRTFAPQPAAEPVQTSSAPSTPASSAPASIAVPVIALSSTSETSTTGVALAGYAITSTGGAVASYSISPSAPAGLTFNTSTGLLSGTPTEVASSTIFTITGSNASGSARATFELTVVLGPPIFAISVASESAATGSSIAGYSIASTGGVVASYSISPAAPAGLTFDTSTGLLSGTPTSVSSNTTYTITGTNAAGSATATFDLAVILGEPSFTISSNSESRTANTLATGFTVTPTGGAVASYSISPSTPAGMSFNTSTGAFTGTPTTVAGPTVYTVTATNATGSFTRTFAFTVVVAVPVFSLSSSSESRTANTVATGFTVSSTGGAVATYSISPSAPAGMSFDTSTGALTGTPTTIAGATVYTVTATNATGSSTATFTFTVVVAAPAFTLSSSSENRTVNTAATGFTVSSTGGAVATYSISPSAPAGMSFDTSTGALTGTPTTIAGATVYTVTATNATGSSTATFTFTVVVAAPAFTLSSNSESRATGSSLAGYTISSTGGAVASYSISPSVPAGLTFDTSTGLLSGSPTSVASATTYTITATNTSGTATATFELTVTLGAPAFTLSATSETRSAGTALSGYTISSTGGTIASYAISPSAPTGLAFSTSTGLLSGTPTVAASATTYTITATNATGSSTAEFVLTVNVGAASKAMITTQPSGAVNGLALTSQPVVRITDSSGNTVTTSTVNVVASIGSGSGGSLSGTTTVAAVNGVATFTDLVLSGTAGNFTLTFTPTSLTAATSSSFALSVGAASKAMITTQPSGAVNGSAFTTQPIIRITDASGNTVTSSTINVIASIASGSGTLSGATIVAAVNGVASFTDLLLSGTAGNFTLTFTPTSLTAATSSSFALSVGAASKAMITTQPSGAVNGLALTSQPVVRITDSSGNTVTTSTVNVVASIGSGSGGSLSGTTTVAAVNGVATFTGLVLSGTAGNFTLTFTPTSLTAATSSSFALSVGAASKAMITTQPSGAVNGLALTSQPVVRITDSSGNTVTTSTVNVVASIGSGSGGSLSGTTTVAAVNGVATFTGLVLSGTAGNFTLTFTPTSLTAATSSSFALSVGAASKAMITTQPSGAFNGSEFSTQPVVKITDSGGNIITTSTVNVVASLASGAGTLSGTTTVVAVSGIATFSNLKITGTGNHTLTFTPAGGLTATTSNTINVADLGCAQGGSCSLGETGPGGGKVFYYSAAGFNCGASFTSTGSPTGGLCHYLEHAAAGWNGTALDPYMYWSANMTTSVGATSTEIGSGFMNSELMRINNGTLRHNDGDPYAGAYIRSITLGGKSDWYLPSKDELNQLCKWARGLPATTPSTPCDGTAGTASNIQNIMTGWTGDHYWSSSESEASKAHSRDFRGNTYYFGKVWRFIVRPIRSF